MVMIVPAGYLKGWVVLNIPRAASSCYLFPQVGAIELTNFSLSVTHFFFSM